MKTIHCHFHFNIAQNNSSVSKVSTRTYILHMLQRFPLLLGRYPMSGLNPEQAALAVVSEEQGLFIKWMVSNIFYWFIMPFIS
jgi:hypothetical protein